jgi:glyoxylase-like metal-dependent hydrolase (beta-lactamase superfamily II)
VALTYRLAATAAVVLTLIGSGAGAGAAAHAAASGAERPAIEKAAAALGGRARIEALKNITLVGYGQYAYVYGAGNISGDPNAPEKYEAANDLRRIYDLEHGRYQQLERRYELFPFAIPSGHDYHLLNQILDGDIAYDVMPNGDMPRIYRWKDDVHQLDGVHMRRMWSLNNPVALVRAALDPATQVSKPRRIHGLWEMELRLPQGDRLSLALNAATYLPAWVRWSNPESNFGQLTLTTYFSGYAPQDGVLLPLGYLTRQDWRNVDYLKIYVDAYVIDGRIAALAAPAAVRAAPEPPAVPKPVTAVAIAPGIWRLSNGTTVFEFEDHLSLFDLESNQFTAQAALDFARTLVPGKPVTQLIASHSHTDHMGGLRLAVAEGLTVISRRNNEAVLREMVTHAAPDFPDRLASHPKAMKFVPVDEHLRLSDRLMTVDLYWARANTHMADAIFAYVPAAKLIAEGDMATAAFDYQWWPDNYEDNLEHYGLDVALLSPVHSVWPEHPDVLTEAQVLELIRGGVQRARSRCAAELLKGNYFPGCPVPSKRY